MNRIYLTVFGLIVACCLVIGLLVWQTDNSSVEMPQDLKVTEKVDLEKDESEPAAPESEPTESVEGKKEEAPSPEPSDEDVAEQASGDDEEAEAEDELEAVNLKNVEMKTLLDKIAQWTGKVVIPHQDVMSKKLTVISDQKLPRAEVLQIIYAALEAQGFIVEEEKGILYLKPSDQARIKQIPTIGPDEPLALMEDKTQRVQKMFKLKVYSPSKLQSVIQPLIGEGGHVMADDATKNMVVIESIANLMRIEQIIRQLDIPEASTTETATIALQQGEPVEIVRLLGILIGGQVPKVKGGSRSRYGGGGSSSMVPITSVITGPSKNKIVLIPVPRQNWIIVRASADDMRLVKEWVEKLDITQPAESEYETVPVQFVPANDLADMLNRALQQMPGAELKSNVLVEPLPKAKQVMIFGSTENRELVKKLILESDIPSEQFLTQQFKLEHVDTEHVKEHLEALYEDINANLPYYMRRRQSERSDDSVRVISFPTAKQVTVIASPENMVKVAQQIADWDQPIDVDEVKPHIISVRNTDPVKLAELLSTLFSDTTSSGGGSFWDRYYGGGDDKEKIVGPLFGQLTFEAVPDTKKIIVISNIPAAYPVIEQLIEDLDSEEIAEVPMVVTLEYADPEELCDQLNALLNETGTTATLQRSQRGLSNYQTDETTGQKSNSESNQENENSPQSQIKPWWNQARQSDDEMPTSNLIGRIRFIPVARSKAIMVLAPPEYKENLTEMINELDKPGKQVMIKAVILEIGHDDMTSLGLKFSSNPLAFGTLSESAIAALTQMFIERGNGDFTFSGNVAGVLDLLVKETDAKILNQPTLWTKDNKESEIFKGSSIGFLEEEQSSSEGTSINQSYKYRPVGVTLRARPNITPENAVDMTVNLIISTVLDELVNNTIATNELNTTTHAIVKDGDTIILSGMLFQNESKITSKFPLLGDLPLIGGLFRHTKSVESNNELLVFITPYVMDENRSPMSSEQLGESLETLEAVKSQLAPESEEVVEEEDK